MLPSRVTWPTMKVGTPVFLAKAISRPALSRTWLTLPGALPSSGRNIVWMESMTSVPGLSFSVAESTFSRSVSANRCSSSPVTPRRSARMRVCTSDSSPET